MKRSKCKCQIGECPNTSVIIVPPFSPPLCARLESCQRLFSGLVLACPHCFNTPNTPASLHQQVDCGQLNSPFQLREWQCCCLLAICWLMTSHWPLTGLGCAVHVFGKNYLSTPQYHTGSAKIIKGIRRSKMWDYWKKSSCLINVKTSTTGFSPERWIACVTCMLLSNRDYYEWWCYGESRSQIMIKLHDENRSLKPHNSKLFPLYIKSVSKHKKSV